MALGGGNFTLQNKVLPGSYINFVSVANTTLNSAERGYAAMPLELDWGLDDAIFTVTASDFQKNSRKIFGYDYTDEKLKGIRDLFKNASVVYFYKLTSGGEKAENTFAKALYSGTRGNDITITIAANVDAEGSYDVKTYLGTKMVDEQTVTAASELAANDFVEFKSAELVETSGMPLTGGTNGTVDGASHQAFLDKIEKYTAINAIGAVTTEETIKSLYAAFTKRMREKVGVKFQTVLFRYAGDHECIVNEKNTVLDDGAEDASMVYWTTGVIAACAVNASNTNKVYDGEFSVDVEYTQAELEAAIKAGEFTFHQVGDDIRVLTDINSLVTTTEDKGEIFKTNQTIRVIDQIATDIANIFGKKYLGVVPNDADGRIGLWNDIVKHHKSLQDIRAIEDFEESDVTVEQGEDKRSVVVTDSITVVNTMEKLYMTVTVA